MPTTGRRETIGREITWTQTIRMSGWRNTGTVWGSERTTRGQCCKRGRRTISVFAHTGQGIIAECGRTSRRRKSQRDAKGGRRRILKVVQTSVHIERWVLDGVEISSGGGLLLCKFHLRCLL